MNFAPYAAALVVVMAMPTPDPGNQPPFRDSNARSSREWRPFAALDSTVRGDSARPDTTLRDTTFRDTTFRDTTFRDSTRRDTLLREKPKAKPKPKRPKPKPSKPHSSPGTSESPSKAGDAAMFIGAESLAAVYRPARLSVT